MRLDKFLCDNNIGTRSQVKEYIKKGQVAINGQIVKKPETKVNASNFQAEDVRDKFSPFWSFGASWLISNDAQCRKTGCYIGIISKG